MITSKSNDLIKLCLQIKQKKHSKELGLCLVESLKLVRELEEKRLAEEEAKRQAEEAAKAEFEAEAPATETPAEETPAE